MLPPGPRLPSIVQTLQWLLAPAGSLEELFKRYGDIFMVHNTIFGREVVLTRPDHMKLVLTGDPEVFPAGEAAAPFEPFLGRGSVLLLDGPDHLRLRRLMLPAFHGERMRGYTETMRTVAELAVARWRPGEAVSIREAMARITLDIILRAVLGLEEGPEMDGLRERLTRMLERIQSPTGAIWLLPALRKDLGPFTPWRAIVREIQETDALLLAHITARRAAPPGDDVLAMLLDATDEEGRKLDDRDLRDQLITLLAAGHETSATALAWVFEEVLRHPGEQERLIEEATSILGGGPLLPEHLPRLERIDSVVKETLRLHPPTAAVGRRLKRPITIDGYDIPPGVLVALCMHLTHRRPELYPDPDRFIPDRFIGKKIDPYEWLPFGGGTRRCLGMAFAMHEMKVILGVLFGRGVRLRLSRPGPYKTALRSFVYAPKGSTRVVVEGVVEG